MKFPIAMFALVFSLSGFGFQLQCKETSRLSRYDYRTLEFNKSSDTTASLLYEQKGYAAGDFMQAMARYLKVPFENKDTYRVTVPEAIIQQQDMHTTNLLIGRLTFAAYTQGLDAKLEHTYLVEDKTVPEGECRKFNAVTDTYHFKVESVSTESIHKAVDSVVTSSRQLQVELKVVPKPYTTLKEFLSFSPSDCRGKE